MEQKTRIALAQINPVVGDLEGNAQLIIERTAKAREAGAGLVVFPEMALCGYPPEDLLIRPRFVARCARQMEKIAQRTEEATVILGAPVERNGLFNAACVLAGGGVRAEIFKKELPNYGVFDERRYFTPGDGGPLIKTGPAIIGITVCEDIWVENGLVENQAARGANLLVNISASPFRLEVDKTRTGIGSRLARRHNTPLAYCNIVGGQDELVFDGRSFITGPDGNVSAFAGGFCEDLLIADVPLREPAGRADVDVIDLGAPAVAASGPVPDQTRRPIENENEEIYQAITLGTRDYVEKNGFREVVVALSGGIDSAMTTAIAVDALGPDRVHVVAMPSPHSSEGSVKDSEKLAENLGLSMMTLPIGDIMESYDRTLAGAFAGRDKDIAEENIQARIRGALVMALSNKFGWLTLATGNKSEIAMGYCTLYGDMAGGFAVIKDVFKTRVYAMSRWRNEKAGYDLIPDAIITKEPSAELRPDQKDSDSLPPYGELDPILEAYIERDLSVEEIVASGAGRDLALRVVKAVDKNEYKRRQGPIGVKITPKAFGRDRRHPITCRYVDE